MPPRKKKGTVKAKSTSSSSTDELTPEALRRVCEPKSLGFDTTDELPRLQDVIGQPRAFRALELGTEVAGPGFNIFALGLPSSGKTTLIHEYLERKAVEEPTPDDWCYVNNFDNPHQPKLLKLPPGRGVELRKDIQDMVDRCLEEIPRIFESEEYSRERGRLTEGFEKRQSEELSRLKELAAKYDFKLAQSPFGFVLVPIVNGKPLEPEEVQKLSPEQRAEFESVESEIQEEVKKSVARVQEKQRSTHEQVQELNSRTAHFAVQHLVEALKGKYAELDQVVKHCDAVMNDIVENASQFGSEEDKPTELTGRITTPNSMQRYNVNVLVDNAERSGAPVVVENHPSYHNLLGRIEHEVVMGASRTNFTLIRPGALHRANGGYLILPAREVHLNPYAWEGLERSLRESSVRIVELGTQLGVLSTATLEPEPMPLDVKVILIGTPSLYYLLRAYDEDFAKLFKVKAEFATLMDRTSETEQEYALFAKAVVDANNLPSLDNTAVARIIEHGSRLAGEQGKLSTRFGKIADLIREAAHWAKKEDQEIVTRAAIDQAIDEGIYRSNLVEERIQEMIAQGTLLIDTSGEAVGQVNALSVMQMGDYAFGRPSRVTATAHPGRGGVVDVEREAKLGGPIHTKGVLIISGLLGSRFGNKGPLSLTARLTFEQSYEGVEGDSASAAELFALLSAIADKPLSQDRAVTGSVNQYGHIQPVGGINEKIEGFFTTCEMQGLSGSQGVIIPQGNVAHLMLEQKVVEAVKAGKFHIWPISTVDEGLAFLTGLESGEQREDGSYPEGTFNHAVTHRLTEFSDSVRDVDEEKDKDEGEKAETD